MDMLMLIGALSMIMWYLIDRFKGMWAEMAYGKYITIGCAAILGFVLAFGYNLDIILAAGLVEEGSTLGVILTGLTLMSGSSAVNEIITKIKGE
jgi:hypothetical protein